MASANVVLINNAPLFVDRQPIVVSKTAKAGVKYTTKRGHDVTEIVLDMIKNRLDEERDDPLFPYLTSHKLVERTDYILKIRSIYTPIFWLKKTIAEANSRRVTVLKNHLTGKMDNITPMWNRARSSFYAESLVSYANTLPLLESLLMYGFKANTQNPSLRLKHEGNDVMKLITVDCSDAVINPFRWFNNLQATKLFRVAFLGSEAQQLASYDEPCVFNLVTHRGSVTSTVATCYDILQMCNINRALSLSVRQLTLLTAALALDQLGITNEHPLLPLKGTMFQVIIPVGYVYNTTESVDYLKTYEEAQKKYPGLEAREIQLLQLYLVNCFGVDNWNKYYTDFERAVLL